MKYCADAGLPEPFYKDMGSGYAIIFEKEKGACRFDYYEELSAEANIERSSWKVSDETTQETAQETAQETMEDKMSRKGSDKDSEKGSDKTTQKTTQRIIELIRKNPKISRKDMSRQLGNISEDGVKYHLSKLKEIGILKRIGSTRYGYWEINK